MLWSLNGTLGNGPVLKYPCSRVPAGSVDVPVRDAAGIARPRGGGARPSRCHGRSCAMGRPRDKVVVAAADATAREGAAAGGGRRGRVSATDAAVGGTGGGFVLLIRKKV